MRTSIQQCIILPIRNRHSSLSRMCDPLQRVLLGYSVERQVLLFDLNSTKVCSWCGSIFDSNPSGRALALTLACYAPCDTPPPRYIHWKCLIFWDTRPLNNSTDTEYAWMPQTHLTGWFFIFSVQVRAITPVCRFSILSKKDFWIKLVFMFYIHPDGRQHFAKVTPLSRAGVIVVPPFDHPWRLMTSRESRVHHHDAQLIYRIQKSLLPRTMHFPNDRVLCYWRCRRHWYNGIKWVYYLLFCACLWIVRFLYE